MSLVARKPRPLRRDATSLRDDRLFIIACDDTYAPKQYFDFFQITRIKIHVIETKDGTSAAAHVLERLQSYKYEEDDERWLLLDTDHCIQGRHLQSFTQAISEAKRAGISVALSKPSFELWLLLHIADESQVCGLPNAEATEKALRAALGEYSKVNLKRDDYPLNLVREACLRAERLDGSSGGDVPDQNTSRVYLLWKAVIAKALSSQLPIELQNIK